MLATQTVSLSPSQPYACTLSLLSLETSRHVRPRVTLAAGKTVDVSMSLSCSLFLSLSPSLYCRWTPVEALLPCTHEPLARTASRALQDAAAKWWSPYKSFNLPWEEFCELLRNKFADTATTIRLQTQLYFTKQQEKEPGR